MKTAPPNTQFESWIHEFPGQFPEIFDPEKIHLNPFIQDQQEYTYRAVRNGLKFLEEIALPWPNSEAFDLGKDATWGYIHILQCLSKAMEFEDKHRDGGGFEVPEGEGHIRR